MEQNNCNDATLQQLNMEIKVAHNKMQDLKAELADIMEQIVSQKESRVLLENRRKRLKQLTEMTVHEKVNSNKNVLELERPVLTILPKEVVAVLSKYLKTKNLLLCRRVCKKWRLEVDDFIEVSYPRYRFCKLIEFKNDDSLTEQAIQDILNSKNPFTMRAVKIEETANSVWLQHSGFRDDEAFARRFWQKVKFLLDTFQKRISYFTLHTHFLKIFKLPTDSCSPTELIRRNLLDCLPNLKSLEISGSQSGEENCPYNKYEMLELPNFRSLCELNIEIKLQDKDLIRQIFSKYSKQIKYLSINSNSMLEFSTIGFLIASKFAWPNLTELALGRVEMDLISLTNLEAFPFLEKLSVTVDENENNCLEGILLITNQLVQVASKFNSLQLIIRKVVSIKEINNLPLGLYASEKLKHLEVDMCPFGNNRNYNHFAFLLKFPFIKNLYIDGSMPLRPLPLRLRRQLHNLQNNIFNLTAHEIGEEIVEVYKFAMEGRNMQGSNIWELLPSLNILTAYGRKYKRSTV